MKITPENISDRLLYEVLYEYARKCGLDDIKAVNVALRLHSLVQAHIASAGGDVELVPED
jgi:hypothetical protein